MELEYASRKIYASQMKRIHNFFSATHFAMPLPTVNYSLFTINCTHTFSAKEKDTETGLSYFGARYYSSDLSIWLSVDPMSDYYPDNSPYVYCGNNPITYIDEIGMDFINFNLERSFYEDPPQKTDPQKPNSKNNPYVLDEVEIKTKTRQEPPKPKRSGSITIPFLPFLFTQVGEAIETVVSSSYVVSIFVGLSTLMQGDTRPQGSQTVQKTNKQIAEIAKKKGLSPCKEFGYKHGRKIYKKGDKQYSYDIDKHNGGYWKVFVKKNGKLQRVGTADKDLKIFKK